MQAQGYKARGLAVAFSNITRMPMQMRKELR